MACTSGSVQKVADKTVAAKQQIDKLQEMAKAQESVSKSIFYAEIATHLTDANVKDAKEIGYNSDVKTEYTSEFSLDKIAGVITAALTAFVKAMDPTVKVPAMSASAIAAYTDVVNSVAEAAKSSSTASTSLSFSMNRLSPGLYAFLYATSTTIKDADTFGVEAVTTTVIHYRLMQSIDDVKNNVEFGEAIIDAMNLLNMKTLQAALTDDLASSKINIDEWLKKDAAYSAAIDRIRARLAAHNFDTGRPFMLLRGGGFGRPVRHDFSTGSVTNQEVVRSSIDRLQKMGAGYKEIIEKSTKRLSEYYF